MIDFPKTIINEVGEKMVVNSGNILFLKSCIYTSNHYPVRLLLDEGRETVTCAFVVFISDEFLFCIDTSSTDKNFMSMFKIPLDKVDEKVYNRCRFQIYVTEVLCK